MMLEHPLFSIAFTLIVYMIMGRLQKKFQLSFLNPLLFSAITIIALLLFFNIDFETYNQGACIFTYLIAPATVALAIPLYKHQNLLKDNFKMIIISIFTSSLLHATIISGLILFLKLDLKMAATLLPKSVTTAIASEISTNLAGYTNITIATVIITGIFGASIATSLNNIFKIDSKRAQGLALGASAHVMGTSKAIELGEIQATMATLAVILSGIFTVVIVPITYQLLTFVI